MTKAPSSKRSVRSRRSAEIDGQAPNAAAPKITLSAASRIFNFSTNERDKNKVPTAGIRGIVVSLTFMLLNVVTCLDIGTPGVRTLNAYGENL